MITLKGVVILRLADLIFRIVLPYSFLSYFCWLKEAKRTRISAHQKKAFLFPLQINPSAFFSTFDMDQLRKIRRHN